MWLLSSDLTIKGLRDLLRSISFSRILNFVERMGGCIRPTWLYWGFTCIATSKGLKINATNKNTLEQHSPFQPFVTCIYEIAGTACTLTFLDRNWKDVNKNNRNNNFHVPSNTPKATRILVVSLAIAAVNVNTAAVTEIFCWLSIIISVALTDSARKWQRSHGVNCRMSASWVRGTGPRGGDAHAAAALWR